jgi:nucleoside-triphosphatase THEP1
VTISSRPNHIANASTIEKDGENVPYRRREPIFSVRQSGNARAVQVKAVVDELGRRGIPVAGFFQPAIVENRKKIGFRVQDAATGEVLDLARRVAPGDGDFGTSFEFFDAGFDLGRRALAGLASGSVLVIDELGPIELRGGGHWPAVERALTTTDLAGHVGVVRRTLVPALVEALDAGDVIVVDLEVEDIDPLSVVIDALVTGS